MTTALQCRNCYICSRTIHPRFGHVEIMFRTVGKMNNMDVLENMDVCPVCVRKICVDITNYRMIV